MTEEKKVLITIFATEDSINYDYNLEEEDFIIGNSLFLCGLLEKIKKNMLDIESISEAEEDNEEDTQENESE